MNLLPFIWPTVLTLPFKLWLLCNSLTQDVRVSKNMVYRILNIHSDHSYLDINHVDLCKHGLDRRSQEITHKQTNKPKDGRYQVHYLPASRSIKMITPICFLISGIFGVTFISQPDVIFHTSCQTTDTSVINGSSTNHTMYSTYSTNRTATESTCPQTDKEWIGYLLTFVTGLTNTIRNALIRKYFCDDGDISWTFWASIGSIVLSGNHYSVWFSRIKDVLVGIPKSYLLGVTVALIHMATQRFLAVWNGLNLRSSVPILVAIDLTAVK